MLFGCAKPTGSLQWEYTYDNSFTNTGVVVDYNGNELINLIDASNSGNIPLKSNESVVIHYKVGNSYYLKIDVVDLITNDTIAHKYYTEDNVDTIRIIDGILYLQFDTIPIINDILLLMTNK